MLSFSSDFLNVCGGFWGVCVCFYMAVISSNKASFTLLWVFLDMYFKYRNLQSFISFYCNKSLSSFDIGGVWETLLWEEIKSRGSGNKLTKDLNILEHVLAFYWILYDVIMLICLCTFSLYLKLFSFYAFKYLSVVDQVLYCTALYNCETIGEI